MTGVYKGLYKGECYNSIFCATLTISMAVGEGEGEHLQGV